MQFLHCDLVILRCSLSCLCQTLLLIMIVSESLTTEVDISSLCLIVFHFPERIYHTASGVMCLDFSRAHPNLLAVSLIRFYLERVELF